jgi:hypothetical protein
MCVDCILASPRIAQVDPRDEALFEVVLSHTTSEVLAFHISLPDLLNRWSSAFHLRAPPDLRLSNLNISEKPSGPFLGLIVMSH